MSPTKSCFKRKHGFLSLSLYSLSLFSRLLCHEDPLLLSATVEKNILCKAEQLQYWAGIGKESVILRELFGCDRPLKVVVSDYLEEEEEN